MPIIMKTGLWMNGRGCCGQMRQRLIALGLMERCMCGNKEENHYQTELLTPTVKHEGGNNLMVWGCMGWNGVGKPIEVQGKMDAEQYCEILMREWWKALKNWICQRK